MLFASVDLKDVYFSVKFLQNIKILSVCFSWEIVWISGSATWVSRFHTYLDQTSKPVLSWLRCLGHTVLAFIDDTLLQGDRTVRVQWWRLVKFRFLWLHCPLSKICLTTYSKNWISRVLVGFGQHDCFLDWQESQEDQISVCGIAGNGSVFY